MTKCFERRGDGGRDSEIQGETTKMMTNDILVFLQVIFSAIFFK